MEKILDTKERINTFMKHYIDNGAVSQEASDKFMEVINNFKDMEDFFYPDVYCTNNQIYATYLFPNNKTVCIDYGEPIWSIGWNDEIVDCDDSTIQDKLKPILSLFFYDRNEEE